MIQNLILKICSKIHKQRLHKQFEQIQKWQDEMYFHKSRQELENIH